MTAKQSDLEVWMRGPIKQIPVLLQPVAHALLQAEEDIIKYTADLKTSELWLKPLGMASIAFHIQHISGVADRMFTYAKGQTLSEEQLDYLQAEGMEKPEVNIQTLLDHLHQQIRQALLFLESIAENQLAQTRYLGRKKIPTTLIGLLFHAAEHAQRHIGQLLVTATILRNTTKH